MIALLLLIVGMLCIMPVVCMMAGALVVVALTCLEFVLNHGLVIFAILAFLAMILMAH